MQCLNESGLGFDGHEKGATISVAPELVKPDANAEREQSQRRTGD